MRPWRRTGPSGPWWPIVSMGSILASPSGLVQRGVPYVLALKPSHAW